MRKIIVRISYIIYSLRKINKFHLGDTVIYNGEKCVLTQGVANPYWDMINDDKMVYKRIHSSKFKLDRSLKAYWFRFKSSYDFKMGYWYRVDCWNKKLFSKISKY